MTGLVNANQVPAEQLETPLGAANIGYSEDTPVSTSQDIGANFMSGVSRATWNASQRHTSIQQAQEENAPLLSSEDVNKKYGPLGPDGQQVQITDKPMYEDTAELVGKQKASEMDRNAIIQRYSQQNGILKSFGAGAVGTLMDPANAASLFVPGVGEETVLARAAKLGLSTDNIIARTGARAITGATGAVAGQTPLDLLKYGMDKQQASDYDLKSAFKDMFYAAAGGAIIHGGIAGGARELGFLKPDEAMNFRSQSAKDMDAVLNADATQKSAAMKSAVSQMVEGREVDVEPSFPMEGERGSNANVSDVAERQQDIYREGFAPNMTSNELETATNEVLPPKESNAKISDEPKQLDESVVDRYKGMVNDLAQKNGIPIPDDVLDRVSRKLAEEHNPEASKAPTQSDKVNLDSDWIRKAGAEGDAYNMQKGGEAVAKEVQNSIDQGKKVTLIADGKPIEITGVSNGMMQDAKGQRWGTMLIATDKSGKNRVEIKELKKISDAKAAESLGIETKGLNSEKLHDEVTAHKSQINAESKFSQELGKESTEARSKYEPERGNYANETAAPESREGNLGKGEGSSTGSESGQNNQDGGPGTGEPISQSSENGPNPAGSKPGSTSGNANGSEPSSVELHPEEQAIADLENQIDLGKLTAEERADLAQSDTALRAANDLFQQKQEEYTSCLAQNI